jgi:D-sedoheptulose 7-phosphate isomerase
MNFSLENYFDKYSKLLELNPEIISKLNLLKKNCVDASSKGRSIFVLGNGGSAAMASHFTVDMTKNAEIRAINFNEADLITCFANDYGFEFWMLEAIRMYSKEKDIVILISSSGKSKNILNAAKWTLKNKRKLITFSGMNPKNPLRMLNKNGLNFWVDSMAYNQIEMVHHIWLLAIVDMIIGKAEYKA